MYTLDRKDYLGRNFSWNACHAGCLSGRDQLSFEHVYEFAFNLSRRVSRGYMIEHVFTRGFQSTYTRRRRLMQPRWNPRAWRDLCRQHLGIWFPWVTPPGKGHADALRWIASRLVTAVFELLRYCSCDTDCFPWRHSDDYTLVILSLYMSATTWMKIAQKQSIYYLYLIKAM